MIRLTLILGAASFLVHVFAIVTPWWVYRRDDDAKYGPYTGLWQTCTSVGSGEYKKHVCSPIGYVTDRVQWTRTMEVFAMITMAVSLLSGIGKEFVLKNNRVLLKAGAGSGITAGALMLIGVFIYSSFIADLNKDSSSDKVNVTPHASFGLCILAAIGAIVSGILFIVWYKNDSTDTTPFVPGSTTLQYGHMTGSDALGSHS